MSVTEVTKTNNRLQNAIIPLIASGALLLITYNVAGLTNTLLALVGLLIGLTLVFGNFGFTGGWSAWIYRRDGSGIRAQMLILAIASILFYPILAAGTLFGNNVTGFVPPIGIYTLLGGFLFGIGMQLGGCCASGALSWAGSGSVRVLITLIGFIIGSVWAAYDINFWRSLPGIRISLTNEFGVLGGLGITLLICASVYGLSLLFEKKPQSTTKAYWPIITVILLLVLGNFLTLAIAGRPWGVTSAFALWGSKALTLSGADLTGWTYWQNSEALDRSIFFDITTVMNLGILCGAFIAAKHMEQFKPNWNIPFKMIIISIFGGLCLGYGARIAYGCNIGAFFSGISSASLSGWVWFPCAFMGNIAGAAIKKRVGV